MEAADGWRVADGRRLLTRGGRVADGQRVTDKRELMKQTISLVWSRKGATAS